MNARRSCLARPLDPSYPTNRAVIIILPIAGLVAAGVGFLRGVHDWHLLLTALGGAGTAFVAWALARELAPDDNPAAFVSMALAYGTFLRVPHTSVMLVFLTIALVRILNRSVGIPARPVESAAIVLLVGWTIYSNRNPLPAVVAAVAFALDAILAPVLRWQWVFAVACMGLASLVTIPTGASWNPVGPIEIPWLPWALGGVAAVFIVVIVRTQQLTSTCDLTGEPLSPPRVQAGMAVGLMVATTGILPLTHGLAQSALVWAVLLGVILGRVWSMARAHSRRPTTINRST
jgi:hypothetical protein